MGPRDTSAPFSADMLHEGLRCSGTTPCCRQWGSLERDGRAAADGGTQPEGFCRLGAQTGLRDWPHHPLPHAPSQSRRHSFWVSPPQSLLPRNSSSPRRGDLPWEHHPLCQTSLPARLVLKLLDCGADDGPCPFICPSFIFLLICPSLQGI